MYPSSVIIYISFCVEYMNVLNIRCDWRKDSISRDANYKMNRHLQVPKCNYETQLASIP